MQAAESQAWDAYVLAHPQSTVYHLSVWRNVIGEAYDHNPIYIAATRSDSKKISGVLPLFHLKSFLFGNLLVSIPFFDMGGVLANGPEEEDALVAEAVRIGKDLNAKVLELRYHRKVSSFSPSPAKTQKARMLLGLPSSAELLMKGFKSKLRSQINKAIRDGLESDVGGIELLDEFYEVFLVNMRDLGSPVHSRKLLECVLKYFSSEARIFIVRKDGRPLAGSIVLGFKSVLANPWASSLRQYSHLSPNMLLYWTMLEYACEKGYHQFDFGRSTIDEGTYKFKAQWGARPEALNWMSISLNGGGEKSSISEDSKFQLASQIWKRLPVSVTRVIGPRIRKYIAL
jgi:FemAB-related protein (PEP-CTERM system-associated)